MISRRDVTGVGLALLAVPFALRRARAAASATLYKAPECGCCADYAKYLRSEGFAVTEIASNDLPKIRQEHRVPETLAGCHVTFIENYVVEGHVPIGAVRKLLAERPPIKGISLPGMPEGSPGMTGQKQSPFVIYEIAEGKPKVFTVE